MGEEGKANRHTGGAGAGVQSQPSTGFVPLFVAPSPEELGASIPQYEVLSLIGQGGMGAVYKARQPKLDRFVAIKLLPAQVGNDVPGFAERFDREARAMAQLNHPNIVTVHDYGETEDGHRYIVMEFVQGKDLHAAIASGTVRTSDVLAWAPQICAGLDYAHRHHLVHRDIKPANILISDDGQAKVGDFGLAKLVGSSRDLSLTQSQVSLGTPDYAAPEALQPGAEIDHRADIYSFGVVLYQMLTGLVPRGAWKAPSAIRPVDSRLDRIVVKAMQPDPDHRYQRMGQILDALEEIKRVPIPVEAPPAAKAAPSSPRGNGKKRMHPLLVALIAVAGVVVTTGVILVVAADQMGLKGVPGWGTPSKPFPPRLRPAEKRESKENRPSVADARPGPRPKPGDLPAPVKPSQGPDRPSPAPSASRPGEDGWIAMRTSGDAPGSGSMPESGWELWPPPPSLGYEIRSRSGGKEGGGNAPVEVRFPVRDSVALLELGGKEPTRVALRWEDLPETVAVGKFGIPLGDVLIRVVGKDGEIGLQVTQDGTPVLTWQGGRDTLPAGERETETDRRVRLRTQGTRQIPALAFRSLPADAWISLPAPVPTPDPLALLTKPELSVPVGNPGSVPAMVPAPDPAESARSSLAAQVAELRTRFDGLEAELAVAGYERKMAFLRETYQAALNRSVGTDASLPLEAAIQRELNRIRDREPIEDTDPPEIPETVRKLREVFRKESFALEEGLRLATAPILREHLAALQALIGGATGQDPALAQAQEPVLAEIRRVQERLERVSPAANPESPPTEAVPATGMPANATPAVRLLRPAFPPVPPVLRGSVRIRALQADSDVLPAVMAVPKGLNGNVVDVAAVDGVVAALKSNGRVEIWGEGVTPEVAADVSSVDRVARFGLARRGERGQIALLLEDGTVQVRELGEESRIPGLTDGAENIDNAVELAVVPDGGVALRRDGTLVPWGAFSVPDVGVPPAAMARVRAVGNGLLALAEDGAVHVLGTEDDEGASGALVLSKLGPVQEVWGAGRDGWVRAADGALRPWGSFAVPADDAGNVATAASVAVGPGAFAFGQGSSGAWRFFGKGLGSGLDEAFAGCHQVAITSGFIVGLGPE